MQTPYVNQNQNTKAADGQKQQQQSNNGQSTEKVRLLANLSYLERQLEDVRNNNQVLQESLQAGRSDNNNGNNTVGTQNKLNEVLEGYYQGRIAEVQQMLGSYTGGSATSPSSSVSSIASSDNNSLGSLNSGNSGSQLGGVFDSAYNNMSNSFNQAYDSMSGFVNQGLNSMKDFFGNAANTVGNAVKDGLGAFGNMLGKASEWFVSQTGGSSNPNEDAGQSNSNCTFASGLMLARYFGVMGGGAGEADSQIEKLRGLSGASMDESEGATLSTAAQGLQKLGLNASVSESSLGDLMGGLNSGKKYMLAVNPEKYEESLGKDLGTSAHAVVLMGIRNGMALLFDPGTNKPITVSVGALQNAMSDMGNEVMEVSNPNAKNAA